MLIYILIIFGWVSFQNIMDIRKKIKDTLIFSKLFENYGYNILYWILILYINIQYCIINIIVQIW